MMIHWPGKPGSECPDCGHMSLVYTGVTSDTCYKLKCGNWTCRAEWVGAPLTDSDLQNLKEEVEADHFLATEEWY